MNDAWAKLFESATRWALDTNGTFSEREFGEAMCVAYDSHTRQLLLKRMVGYGLIQPYGGRNGWYIKCDTEAPVIDWKNAFVSEYPIWMPLGLSRRCVISPGNVITVAGEKNSGKSALAYRIGYENLRCNGGQHDTINLYDYESHPAEMKIRLMNIDPNFPNWEGLNTRKRMKDFHKVIDPDGFNIIDYLKIGGTSAGFTEVGILFEQIHSALRNGICIVLVQKKKGEEFARGGELTTEEARLAVSLFSSGPTKWARITKCKFPREMPNPEGMEVDYSLDYAAKFTELTEWRYMTAKEREKVNKDYIIESRREVAVSSNCNRGFGLYEQEKED